MTWKDINVFQYQQLYRIINNKENLSDEEVAIKTLAIVNNKTENQIRNLSLNEINKHINSLQFLTQEFKPEHKEIVYCGKKRYRFNYDVKQMASGRYIETKYFLKDFENNIHKVAASMVIPQRWSLLGWKDKLYDARLHEAYAEDLLNAPISDILGSVVFFCHLYSTWIKSSRDYLMSQMTKMGMTKSSAEYLYLVLWKVSDGFIKRVSLPNLNELDLKKFTNSLQSNS